MEGMVGKVGGERFWLEIGDEFFAWPLVSCDLFSGVDLGCGVVVAWACLALGGVV